MYYYNGYNQKQEAELKEIYKPYIKDYKNNVTGNCCKGDEIVFARAVFQGSYPKATFSHFEIIKGKIIKDSYGTKKQQHTFTIELGNKSTMRIKGRNLYKYLTLAKPRDLKIRAEFLEEKYKRGKAAREMKATRISYTNTEEIYEY